MSEKYWFDEKAADKAVRFFEKYLKHSKGEWAGKPFILADYQKTAVRDIFGWKCTSDGFRRYDTLYSSVARKSGKSTWGAGFGLYLTFADGENFAEVISAAGTREQAGKVFDEAKRMVDKSPALKSRARVFQKTIINVKDGGKYEVISREAGYQHGGNLNGIIFDELHVQPDRELWDVLTTSTGSRNQPLTVALTTAGHDRESICWKIHERALAAIENPEGDPSFYAVIYAAAEEDDWTDLSVWKKANPLLGVTPKIKYLQKSFNVAKDSPPDENKFRRLHLNQWTEQETRWINMERWDACNGEVDAEALKGRTCYAGLDLASTSDMAALVLMFPPTDDEPYALLPYFWIPAENLHKRSKKHGISYDGWVRAGIVDATPGNVIDFAHIRQRINDLRDDYEIAEIAYDPWGAVQLSTQLIDDGFEMVEHRQGFASMGAPTKEFMALVLGGRIAHGNHPVLRWMASNMVVKLDPAGNMKPDKGKAREKIDGIVAAIMATDRAMRNEGVVEVGHIFTI